MQQVNCMQKTNAANCPNIIMKCSKQVIKPDRQSWLQCKWHSLPCFLEMYQWWSALQIDFNTLRCFIFFGGWI